MKYAKNYTFFWRTPGTFSRIDPMLGHNTSLNKFEEAEIIQSMFFILQIKLKSTFKSLINIYKCGSKTLLCNQSSEINPYINGQMIFIIKY